MIKKGGPVEVVKEEKVEEEEVIVPKKVSSDVQMEVEGLCKRAEALLRQGKEDEAVKCFVQALALDEFHQETQHKLAMLYLEKQMFSAASALFKELGDSTKDPVHYSHLGLALYQQSNFSEALEAYQKAIALDPSRPQRFVSLAQVYRALGRLNHAVSALRKAVEIDGENLDIVFFLADLQLELGNTDEALVILKKLLEIEPEHNEAKALLRQIKEAKEV